MRLHTAFFTVCGAAFLVGCGGGQSNSGSYGGFDSTLGKSPGSLSNPTGAPPTPNAAAWPTEDGKAVFVRGINLPVFDGQTGHDIGKNPFKPDAAVWYKGEAVDKQFQELSDIGFNVVRIWLFEDGEGLKVGKDGTVSGLDEAFVKNVEDMAERARAHKIKLYLGFTDSWPEGLKSPFTDKKAQEAYLKKAVAPLARKLKAHDGVFAMDVMSGLENLPAPTKKDEKQATWEQVQAFVKSAVDLIKKEDPERLISVGGESFTALQKGQYAGLGLDFYDVRHFDDAGEMPPAKDLKLDRPVLIGAVAQASTERNDELQATAAKAFAHNAPERGYAGYMIWSYGSKDSKDPNSLVGTDGKPRLAYEAIKKVVKELPAGK